MVTNEDRITWAQKALNTHARATCSQDEAPDTWAVDLLTNLRHWCDAACVDFDNLNRIAAGHYKIEKEDQNDGTKKGCSKPPADTARSLQRGIKCCSLAGSAVFIAPRSVTPGRCGLALAASNIFSISRGLML
jgi:hypothetical protein